MRHVAGREALARFGLGTVEAVESRARINAKSACRARGLMGTRIRRRRGSGIRQPRPATRNPNGEPRQREQRTDQPPSHR